MYFFFFSFLRRRWVTTLTADSVASQHNMMWLLCGWAEDVAWGHDVNHAREVKAIRGRPFCFCAECITRHKKWGKSIVLVKRKQNREAKHSLDFSASFVYLRPCLFYSMCHVFCSHWSPTPTCLFLGFCPPPAPFAYLHVFWGFFSACCQLLSHWLYNKTFTIVC